MLHKAITKTLQRKAKDRRGKNQDKPMTKKDNTKGKDNFSFVFSKNDKC